MLATLFEGTGSGIGDCTLSSEGEFGCVTVAVAGMRSALTVDIDVGVDVDVLDVADVPPAVVSARVVRDARDPTGRSV